MGSTSFVVSWLTFLAELYTDESAGLKVDPVVVLVLSLVFIFSVVALHGMSTSDSHGVDLMLTVMSL